MRSNRLLRGTASLAVLAAFAAGSAYAQDESVQEVIVTAQKREQNLQDVPVVVTSLSETVLENAGVRDIKDLQILTPGLTVTSTSNESVTTARIRGVGTVGDNPGLESSVGVVIDGVYRPRNGVGFGDLGELQRIEVLKGPQGTLFGKNTSSGVINIISEAPAFERGIEAELTAGDYGAWGAALSLTGGLTDNVAGRLYVAGRQRDGFYDVITGAGPRTETDDQNQDFMTVRGQLLFLPSDNAEIRVIADYTDRSERCCVAVQTRTGPTGPLLDAFDPVSTGVAPVAAPFDRIAYANRSTDQDITDQGISMEANVDIASWNATFTSITAFRSWETANAQDTDFSTADIWYREKDDNTVEFETFSQEFRLAGEAYDGRLNWLVGAFYAQEDLTRRDRILGGAAYEAYWSNIILNNLASFAARPGAAGGLGSAGTAVALLSQSGTTFVSESTGIAFGSNWVPGTGFTDQYDQSSTTLALFTNNSFQVTDRLELSLGLRYTMDEKDVTSSFANDGFTGCSYMLGLGGGLGAAGLAAEFTDRGVAAPFIPTLVGIATATACLTGSNTLFDGNVFNQSSDDNEWSGTVKAVYRFNDNLMTYISYARGYKGGGFNLDRSQSSNGLPTGGTGVVPVSNTSFPSEFVDSYELGAKMTLMGGSVLLNATLFNQIYEDFQLNTFLGTTFVVESIPEVTSMGVDADLIWFSPIDGLDFQGGVTFARTEYGGFTAADLSNPSRFVPLSLLPNSNVSFAPEWSWSGSANYERELGSNMRVMGSLSAKYTTDYNTKSDLLPSGLQNSYALFNGRIGIGSADERWTLEIWGQNLTDQDYYQVVFNAPLQGSAFPTNIPSYNTAYDSQTYNAFLGQPRTWGATLRIKY